MIKRFLEEQVDDNTEKVQSKTTSTGKLKIKANKKEIERSLDKAIEKSKNRSRKKK